MGEERMKLIWTIVVLVALGWLIYLAKQAFSEIFSGFLVEAGKVAVGPK